MHQRTTSPLSLIKKAKQNERYYYKSEYLEDGWWFLEGYWYDCSLISPFRSSCLQDAGVEWPGVRVVLCVYVCGIWWMNVYVCGFLHILSPYSTVSGNVHWLNFLSSKNSATRGLHKYADPKFGHCFGWGESREMEWVGEWGNLYYNTYRA